jgi:hypothetical protein
MQHPAGGPSPLISYAVMGVRIAPPGVQRLAMYLRARRLLDAARRA